MKDRLHLTYVYLIEFTDNGGLHQVKVAISELASDEAEDGLSTFFLAAAQCVADCEVKYEDLTIYEQIN